MSLTGRKNQDLVILVLKTKWECGWELCFQAGKGRKALKSKDNIFLQGGREASMTAGGRQDNHTGNHGHSSKLML